jgi:hypothetical protein
MKTKLTAKLAHSHFLFIIAAMTANVSAVPAAFLEGFYLDSGNTSYLYPFSIGAGANLRTNLEFATTNGGITMYSGRDETAPAMTDGGITLFGSPISMVLYSSESGVDNSSFNVWKGSAWGVSQPLLKINALNGGTTFTNSNVTINNGSLTVNGAITSGGNSVVTASSTGQINLTGSASGISVNGSPIFSLDASNNVVFAPTRQVFLGVLNTSVDAVINGVRIGKGNPSGASASTALGANALNSSSGFSNTAVGNNSQFLNYTGSGNTSVGNATLYNNTSGSNNSVVGNGSLNKNIIGNDNVSFGKAALFYNTTGSNNIALGTNGARFHADGTTTLTDSENSIYIGANSQGFNNDDNNSIVIGTNAIGEGANTTVIGNSATTKTRLFGKTITSGLEVAGGSIAPAAGQTIGGLLAMGSGAIASGSNSVSFGSNTIASGAFSTASGASSVASVSYARASGVNSVASGLYATANGNTATAAGFYSFSNGWSTSAKTTLETVFGRYNLLSAQPIGPLSYNELDGLFRLGNGSSASLSDALTVLKNGQSTLTNKAWKANIAANPTQALVDPPATTTDSGGNALVVDGHTVLNGKVIISVPQGDISMGIYQ